MPYGGNIGGIGGGGNPTLYGESPATTWNNTVFKARLLPLTDLADRGIKPAPKIPTNDLLDDFKVGDHVRGIGYKDKQVHQGSISRIQRNSKGDGYRVFIQDSDQEKEKELLPSTLTYVKRSEEVRRELKGKTPRQKDERGPGSSQYTISVEEQKMINLSDFNSFEMNIYGEKIIQEKMETVKDFNSFKEEKLNEADDGRQALSDMAKYDLELQTKGKERMKLAKEWTAAADEERPGILSALKSLTKEMDELKHMANQAEKDFNIASGVDIDETEDSEMDYREEEIEEDEEEVVNYEEEVPAEEPPLGEEPIEEEPLATGLKLEDESEDDSLIWRR